MTKILALPPLVAGIGWQGGTDPQEIIDLVEACLRHVAGTLAAIASIEAKAADPLLQIVSDHFGVPAQVFSAAQLAQAGMAGSPRIEQAMGTPSVAEAAARQFGALVVPKRKSAHATCAIGMMTRDHSPSSAMAPSTLSASGARS